MPEVGLNEEVIVRLGRRLLLDQLAVEVVQALAAAGMPSLVLKGPVTRYLLYADEPNMRGYCDVDLLVPGHLMSATGTVLRGLALVEARPGLRKSELARVYEMEWTRRADETVDLHRSFYGVSDAGAFWSALWSRRVTYAVGGAEILGPDRAGMALLYALHAAQHGIDDEASTKPLTDLARAAAIFEDDVWASAFLLSREVGAVETFAVGLRLDAAASEIARRLNVPAAVSARAWTRAHAPNAVGDRQIDHLVHTRSLRGKLAVARDVLLPSSAMIVGHHAWAERSRGHLAVAYVRRWVLILAWLPRSARNNAVGLRSARAARPRP